MTRGSVCCVSNDEDVCGDRSWCRQRGRLLRARACVCACVDTPRVNSGLLCRYGSNYIIYNTPLAALSFIPVHVFHRFHRFREMSFTAPDGQASLVFAAVFFIVWFGAGVVTLNAQLLGGKISFFQSVCVLGYCIFPLNIAATLCLLWSNHWWRAIVVIIGFIWSTRASLVFMSQLVPAERRFLALYPVGLFYVVIAWMVSVH